MKNLRTICAAFCAVSMLSFASQQAFANITKPDAPATPASKASNTAGAREILDRASMIAFEGAAAVQKLQTLSVDNTTSELLKNYMATMIYIPHAMALPTDAEALDEPWLASTSGTTTEDGMVIPNIGRETEEESDNSGLALSTSKFLNLLKPVQNALLTSGFGFRWGRPHQGIDLAAPIGTPIVSAEKGKVTYAGWKTGYGNFVAVDHGHGYETHYAHCSKMLVRTGQQVSKGQIIAKVGNTGYSTGPHLHFEVVANGVHRNPIKFLNQTLTVVKAD